MASRDPFGSLDVFVAELSDSVGFPLAGGWDSASAIARGFAVLRTEVLAGVVFPAELIESLDSVDDLRAYAQVRASQATEE